ncbi:MAG: hypothetical protein IPJ00_11290 [Saprospirales bacterium]|nr:hypothetical protein [Saprospirales bacterium]
MIVLASASQLSIKTKNNLVDEIKNICKENLNTITQAKTTIGIDDDYETMVNSIGGFNNLIQKIQGVLKESVIKEEFFITDVTELGKIPYSLSQARKEENNTAALVAVLLSIAIDFFVPFLIWQNLFYYNIFKVSL